MEVLDGRSEETGRLEAHRRGATAGVLNHADIAIHSDQTLEHPGKPKTDGARTATHI